LTLLRHDLGTRRCKVPDARDPFGLWEGFPDPIFWRLWPEGQPVRTNKDPVLSPDLTKSGPKAASEGRAAVGVYV
jgi:hypothetical protein